MLNFSVTLPGHDMFTETGIASNFKPRIQASSVSPHLQKNPLKASQPLVEKILILHDLKKKLGRKMFILV